MRMKNRGQGSGVRDQGSGVRGQGSERAEYPSLSTIHYPLSTAFTLVELLVVIVIISMLVGLLMPALISARGRARITQCSNNQHELSLAITQYDVLKKHLPGYVNQVRGAQVNWVPVLFPYLGRMDLWEGTNGANGWRSGAPIPAVQTYLNQLVCPDDPFPSATCPLTYVVNAGVYNNPPDLSTPNYPADIVLPSGTPPTPRGWGIFRDYFNAQTPEPAVISLSDVDAPSHTVMLSELSMMPNWVGRQWNTALTRESLTFSWPNDPPLPLPVIQPTAGEFAVLSTTLVGVPNILGGNTYPPPLPSIHSGIVIVTFCDGHTESLSEDTLCNVYSAVP